MSDRVACTAIVTKRRRDFVASYYCDRNATAKSVQAGKPLCRQHEKQAAK